MSIKQSDNATFSKPTGLLEPRTPDPPVLEEVTYYLFYYCKVHNILRSNFIVNSHKGCLILCKGTKMLNISLCTILEIVLTNSFEDFNKFNRICDGLWLLPGLKVPSWCYCIWACWKRETLKYIFWNFSELKLNNAQKWVASTQRNGNCWRKASLKFEWCFQFGRRSCRVSQGPKCGTSNDDLWHLMEQAKSTASKCPTLGELLDPENDSMSSVLPDVSAWGLNTSTGSSKVKTWALSMCFTVWWDDIKELLESFSNNTTSFWWGLVGHAITPSVFCTLFS